MSINVRDARAEDFSQLAMLDLTYEAGRVLALQRGGTAQEPAFELRWRRRQPREAIYNEYARAWTCSRWRSVTASRADC